MGRVKELEIEKQEELGGTFAVFDEALAKANEIPETKGFHRLTNEHKLQYKVLIQDMEALFTILEEYTKGEIV